MHVAWLFKKAVNVPNGGAQRPMGPWQENDHTIGVNIHLHVESTDAPRPPDAMEGNW